jgi:hypothetical protein
LCRHYHPRYAVFCWNHTYWVGEWRKRNCYA